MVTCEWISGKDAMAALSCTRQQLHRMREQGKISGRRVDNGYEYQLQSLPPAAQELYFSQHKTTTATLSDSEIYAMAPEHSRRVADKYLQIIDAAGNRKGGELKKFISIWNHGNPDNKTSYARLIDARKKYQEHGVTALLGQWGKQEGRTSVPDLLFSYFKSLYLSDGRPSTLSCYNMTIGYAVQKGFVLGRIPSHSAFMRRLTKEVPEQAIYTAREGQKAANRKFGFYIKRDYKNLLSGECWISDHAQIDIACTATRNGKTSVGFPWLTAWRDFKSGLLVGWDLHMEPPNSDHIFTSFYRSAVKHGIPLTLYLDNGKDYRVRDFTGGRSRHKLLIDEGKATALTAALGITTIFAWPYNAQAKSIERDFLRIKEWFSKHAPGYRGGNVVERPESLNATIASEKILDITDLEPLFEQFINDIAMETPLSSGYRKGKCPAQIWEEEYPLSIEQQKVRHVTKNALMLFCTRVTGNAERPLTIGKRGILDSKLGIYYYSPWMEGQKGRKVYMRRDIKAYQEAWVFDAATDSYIDNAQYIPDVDAIAITDIAKGELTRQIALRKNAKKLIKIMARPDFEISMQEKMEVLTNSTRVLNEMNGRYRSNGKKPNAPLMLTGMDKVIQLHDEHQKEGTFDFEKLAENIDEAEERRNNLDIFDPDTSYDIEETA